MSSKSIHILLADDDIDDCNFFRDALETLPLSAKLTIVHDGVELMEWLVEHAAHLPNTLFLDINMPRKNGFECLAEIKKNHQLKDLPVIMFSTSKSQDKINILFKTGAHIYVRKPANFAQLVQVIHHALPLAGENIFSNGKLNYILNA
jgi:CheY-like chemotaxis protein